MRLTSRTFKIAILTLIIFFAGCATLKDAGAVLTGQKEPDEVSAEGGAIGEATEGFLKNVKDFSLYGLLAAAGAGVAGGLGYYYRRKKNAKTHTQ